MDTPQKPTHDTTRESERSEVLAKAEAAKRAAPIVAKLKSGEKNAVLLAAADALETRADDILAANQDDINAGKAAGMSESLIDRLRLDKERIRGIADGLRQVAALTDPVGQVLRGSVIMGMVYEARPNVTVDAFGLALKSGNVALLRGSKSANHTNMQLVAILQTVAEQHGLPAETVQLLPCATHESVQDLITARGLVDVVIPRGGAGLINAVVTGATVPTIETGTGNCHVYIDRDADLGQAITILLNSKTRRCSVCNAAETVLIDTHLSDENKLSIITALQDAGVTIHGDPEELAAFGATAIVPATNADWTDEYLSMDIAARTVDGIDGALDHIRRYSSGHTEAICTTNITTAQRFADEVDSAAVMINASTAFTDGEQYGMGAEIGISTQKLHARGPMALPELTSTKWILHGTGQTRP